MARSAVAHNYILVRNEAIKRAENTRLFWYYPEKETVGPDGKTYQPIDKYPKHAEFFRRGKDTFSRMFMASVGSGKTEALLKELTYHGRGWYPNWWEGIRYDRPLDIWVSGKTIRSVRNILQTKWLGAPYEELLGNGILPLEWLDYESIHRLSQGSIDTFRIRHVSGGLSHVGFMAYEQGVGAYYGTDKDIVAFDEPCPANIYAQALMRTRNRPNARAIYTVAALEGRTETVKLFMDEPHESRQIITCSWDEIPHLTEEWKRNTLANTPAYLHESVKTGLPTRAGGAVYAVKEDQIVIQPIPIPDHWHWIGGFDDGLHNTACGWFALDKDADVLYLVGEYKDGGPGTNPELHGMRILSRCKGFGFEKMPIQGDAYQRDRNTGEQIVEMYKRYGLNMMLAEKAVDEGISLVRARMETGKFKVFSTCTKWLEEYRQYSFEMNDDGSLGKINKVNDHLMDATRYAVKGIRFAAPRGAKPALKINTPGIRR